MNAPESHEDKGSIWTKPVESVRDAMEALGPVVKGVIGLLFLGWLINAADASGGQGHH